MKDFSIFDFYTEFLFDIFGKSGFPKTLKQLLQLAFCK